MAATIKNTYQLFFSKKQSKVETDHRFTLEKCCYNTKTVVFLLLCFSKTACSLCSTLLSWVCQSKYWIIRVIHRSTDCTLPMLLTTSVTSKVKATLLKSPLICINRFSFLVGLVSTMLVCQESRFTSSRSLPCSFA